MDVGPGFAIKTHAITMSGQGWASAPPALVREEGHGVYDADSKGFTASPVACHVSDCSELGHYD